MLRFIFLPAYYSLTTVVLAASVNYFEKTPRAISETLRAVIDHGRTDRYFNESQGKSTFTYLMANYDFGLPALEYFMVQNSLDYDPAEEDWGSGIQTLGTRLAGEQPHNGANPDRSMVTFKVSPLSYVIAQLRAGYDGLDVYQTQKSGISKILAWGIDLHEISDERYRMYSMYTLPCRALSCRCK